MNTVLSPETWHLIEQKLKDGRYRSADEVVRAALAALKQLETSALDDDALDAIDRAEEQIERGDVHDWKDVRERVRGQFLGR